MLQPLLETSTQGSGLTPEQYISLLQTMIRSALSAVAFVVAIFLFLVKEYRDDCERHKSTTRQASERISFAIWVLRMIVHLKVVYAVLVLLAIPSLIVVGLMMAGAFAVTRMVSLGSYVCLTAYQVTPVVFLFGFPVLDT